ncbi:U6 small nuclear RNA (adenine-(43)-N(6))-methyltransferase-like isoform X2 [Artemia franciscana]|uniref:U6 small nuclear RNA (adenine-(43)-N(6))-methyltransferase n=1 Tax=Artemia franciscana TaxID=6661 RepID=A0AA88HUK7_ARTSF|nr:hypothetical protein QYM36_008647 [Artemia franciscana]
MRIHTVSGKATLDFKDQEAVACLTSSLLFRDFQLRVHLPPGRLIPTLPLRLNYLLWIEDLISLLPVEYHENVCGVDIGTGASCIYPLIGSKKFGWKFLATEIDAENFEYARKQVQDNYLEDYIKVIKVNGVESLRNIVGNQSFTFTMCNPPFYAEDNEKQKNNRPSPRHDYGGQEMEVAVEGGEVSFVKKIVEESKFLRDQILIFTTMLGHKVSVKPVKRLCEAAGASVCTTEFCQGRTMRWGVAWTFRQIPFEKCLAVKREKPKPPMTWVVPQIRFKEKAYTVKNIDAATVNILDSLKMMIEPIRSTKYSTMYIVKANENTWVHQRRRRREEKRQKIGQQIEISKQVSVEANNYCEETDTIKVSAESNICEVMDTETGFCDSSSPAESSNFQRKRYLELETVDELDSKRIKGDDSFNYSDELELEPTHLVQFKLSVQKTRCDIVLSVTWIDGTGGIDAMNQVLVYLKRELTKNSNKQ